LNTTVSDTTNDTSQLEFRYHFTFENGDQREFHIRLDGATLRLLNVSPSPPPAWTALEFSKCVNCPLQRESHCPIAVNLSSVIKEFEATQSYTNAKVMVETTERNYAKDTTVQRALSSIIGIIMVTSGCPIMDRLRPNVAFHLPFASPLETSYRSVAMYLTAQAIRKLRGEEPDWDMNGLVEIYEQVSKVNKGMARRIKQAMATDAGANAIVILHAFGDSVTILVETRLKELEGFFSTLLDGGKGNSGA